MDMRTLDGFTHQLPVWDHLRKEWRGPAAIHKSGSINPQPGDVYVDQFLTDLTVGFFGDPAAPAFGMLGRHPVMYQSGIIPTWTRASTMRLITELRTPGQAPKQAGIDTDNSATFFAREWGLEMPYNATQMAQANGGPYNLRRARSKILTMAAIRRREEQIATNIFKTSTWTGSSTGADITVGTQWDTAGSDPVADVEAQILSIEEKTGYTPTHLLVGRKVLSKLRTNAAVLARYRAIGSARGADQVTVVDQDGLDAVFRVKVRASSVTRNTASPGATISMSFAIGAHALLVYLPPDGAILEEPAAFRVLEWVNPELYPGSVGGMRIVSGMDARAGVDWMQIHDAFDTKVIAPECGAYLPNVVA